MLRMRAVVINGRIVVQDRVPFPDGTELEITPVPLSPQFDENELAALRAMFADGEPVETTNENEPAPPERPVVAQA